MLDQNSELFLLLKKMVSFDSIDGNEAGISDFLAQNARDMGMDEVHQQEALPGLKNVIAVKTFGKGGKTVVLNSHMDVVPPADGWDTDPYELIIKGDKESTHETLKKLSPVLLDMLPLTLEEVFTYEMEALGYDYNNILKEEQ